MDTLTPQELAVQIWGRSQASSRSSGPRLIRRTARDLYASEAPGKGGRWHLTADQAAAIRRRIGAAQSN